MPPIPNVQRVNPVNLVEAAKAVNPASPANPTQPVNVAEIADNQVSKDADVQSLGQRGDLYLWPTGREIELQGTVSRP